MIQNKKQAMRRTNRTYRHLIEVWNLNGEEENELKEKVQKPILQCKLWADVVPVRGKEYIEVDKLVPEMQHRIFTRYRKDINQAMIIKWQGRKRNIKAIVDVNGEETEMEILCLERVEVDG